MKKLHVLFVAILTIFILEEVNLGRSVVMKTVCINGGTYIVTHAVRSDTSMNAFPETPINVQPDLQPGTQTTRPCQNWRGEK